MAYAVELKGITKIFPGVVANKNISLGIEWGSIHGLIGENGAGKTTLMKILYGMYRANEGEIFISGEKVHFHSPKNAIAKGVGMVHQHFTLVPSLTVGQNIMLGRPICKKSGLLDFTLANKTVSELGEEFGLKVDPKTLVKDIPVAMQQRVEILKTLYLGADILIMDEPTAVLTPQEIEQLLKTLVLLKEKGKCVILITHKLKELMSVTDNITVLRNGTMVGQVKTSEVNEKKIAAMMVGKEIEFEVPKVEAHPTDAVLSAEHLCYRNKFGVLALDDVTFNVRKGEIVGIAGVQGNGQTELIEVLSGICNQYTGSITLCGQTVDNKKSPLMRRQYGLAHIPEDRQTMGAALGASLLENFIMGGLDDASYTSHGLINYKKAGKIAEEQYKLFDVRFSGLNSSAGSLSGGNLQKAIVAREIYRDPQVLIAAQPSRGVDIGATMFIHEKLIKMRDNGKAIILVSSELSEIMSLSDRILVMYKGTIVGETTPQESTEEDIGLMMAGIRKEVNHV
ncbi:ABC transporter ATP-binding protein [Petroclostridium sp. X23]|uniref:ABC transporter ATP-binding protein n=1 Tax=Petroclostridium sp. X23 TaxID=3045146 RepID=UPI0024AE1EEF|nr:ABC transporter ATP-binding protein [Petroclostridium sp. X23]WHH61234.1 ABC transporter ATP-binding protein [Petroclostridium sp. X23]